MFCNVDMVVKNKLNFFVYLGEKELFKCGVCVLGLFIEFVILCSGYEGEFWVYFCIGSYF